MKRIFLLSVILFLFFECTNAQIEKGYNLTGGSARLSFDSDFFSFSVVPNFGWFIKDRLAVGGQFYVYVSDSEYSTNFGTSLMPFTRYYFGKTKTKFFIHGGIGIGSSIYWTDINDTKEKNSDTDLYINFRAGLAHFIGKHVALEVALVYNSYDIIDEYIGSFGINVGFQIHIFRLFNKNEEQ